MFLLRFYLKIAALLGLVSPIHASECMIDDPQFGPCDVNSVDPAFTDYETVNLDKWRTQWKRHLTEGNVPSLTMDCANKTAESCERGSINWSGKRIVIDSDVANEVDDLVAIAWALLSSVGPSKQVQVESIIAAPFSFRYRLLPLLRAQELFEQDRLNGYGNLTSVQHKFLYGPPESPGGQMTKLIRLKDVGITPQLMIEQDNHATWCAGRGMNASYDELVRFVGHFKQAIDAGIAPAFAEIAETPLFRGQGSFITGSDPSRLEASEGVKDLIERARASTVEDPLFVVSIAAPTNVAAALLIAPDIVGKIVVLWDASWSIVNRGRSVTGSLNMGSDQVASRVLFESGVRMLYFPGFPSGQTLQLSKPEMEAWYKGQGPVSNALWERYNNNPDSQFSGLGQGRYAGAGSTRVMWDTGNFIPFIIPSLLSVHAVSQPVKLQRVKTVDATCNGFETIGTTCQAYYPNDDSNDTYNCKELDPYNQTRCNDGFFVDAPKQDDVFNRALVEAQMLGGLSGPGGSGMDLLYKLQAAGL
jgi:inosine-uridine nucleoside N-ribohydrolase